MYKQTVQRDIGVEKINKVFSYMKDLLHTQNDTSKSHTSSPSKISAKYSSSDKNVSGIISTINHKVKYRPTKEDMDTFNQYPLSKHFYTRYKSEESKYIGKCLQAKKTPRHDMNSAYKLSFTAKECGVCEYSSLYLYFDTLLIDIYNT